MTFTETPLAGAWVIQLTPIEDDRGSFVRTFDAEAWSEHALDATVSQCNLSFNARRGTLRGLHYQTAPFGEAKLVRCTLGAIYDVIVDLREQSTTYRSWFAVELTRSNLKMLYVPEGFAHGFQTLADASEVHYQMSQSYAPTHARGVRWNDPVFDIEWPEVEERIISHRDGAYPDFGE